MDRPSQALQQALVKSEGRLPTITPSDLKPKWEPKKLSQKHKSIIALHLQGVSRVDVGSIAGCTPEYVSMVVRTKLAQAYIVELEGYMEERMKVASMRAVDVIHETLSSADEEIQLKAARLALEATGKLKPAGDKVRSAEDVVAQILAHATTVVVAQNVQVNQGDKLGSDN